MQSIAVNLECFRKTRAPVARAIVLACVLSVGGCAVGPNFTRPAPPSAARYTADTPRAEDASASGTVQHIDLGREIEGNWWTLFRSDAIDQLVTQAVAHNRSLSASTATLQQAQELALAQAGSRYPQVDLTAGVGRQQFVKLFAGGGVVVGDENAPRGHRRRAATIRFVAMTRSGRYGLLFCCFRHASQLFTDGVTLGSYSVLLYTT